ncbi:MAG TPA: MarC family NAAT transporter, partial [Bacteroidota bacterium]|nr:MarC family NAAT transporter [Bacteroidota bacterium]
VPVKELVSFISWVGVALITLLPIINPVSTAVLLLGISTQLSPEERNRQVTRACLYMTAILVTFLAAGHIIMVAFGISIPGIRIAGGLVIMFLGFRMLFPDEGPLTGEGRREATEKPDISFSPLAMPSLSGPGSIAVVITMSSSIDGKHGFDKLFAFAGVVLAIIISAAVSWVVLRGAGFLRRFLGVNGVNSLSRIMGFLLVCIGIQFVIDGIRDLASDTSFWQQ